MHSTLRLASLVLAAFAAAGCGDSTSEPGSGDTRRVADWNAVKEWTAEKRDQFITAARRQHDALGAEATVLRQRLDQVAEKHRPAVEAALADFEQLKERHRAELYRLSNELQSSASDAFDSARLESSKVRAQLYEAYETARKRLEQALADSATETPPVPAETPSQPADAAGVGGGTTGGDTTGGASDADAPADG